MSKETETDNAKGDEEGVAKNKPIKKMSELVKLKLDKLMQNFEKPVCIPERPKSKNGPTVPEFVRNVMGSSAGAGSGEFHVYRHLRRKEYARRKFIENKSEAEKLDDAFHEKLEENKRKAEEETAKKRAKRLRKKENAKRRKLKNPKEEVNKKNEDSESDSESDN